MWLASGPNDVMTGAEDVNVMDRSLEGHAMRRLYLGIVYYVVHEEVMRNVSGDVLWREGVEGSVYSV